MAAPKPNPITTTNSGLNGDTEYVVACKGRPFAILTSPQLPTPPITYVDYGLIQDLGLRMTDLQCRKLYFSGEKLRILGKVSTSVQCIINGAPLGNMHFKAHVVEDLKKVFNTHAIACEKLHKKFDKSQLSRDDSTEPTDDEEEAKKEEEEKPKEKKRKKSKPVEKKNDPPKSEKKPSSPSTPNLPTPPRPICQGNWTKYQSYQGWHPEHGYGGPPGVLRACYRDRRTGQTQGEKPSSWDSYGSLHSLESAATAVFSSSSSDEYDDEYTNVSTIRHYDDTVADSKVTPVINSAMTAHPPPFLSMQEAREAFTASAAAVTNSCPASPNTILKMMNQDCVEARMDTAETVCASVDTNKKTEPVKSKKAMISHGKPFTKEDLQHVTTLRREGKIVPASLKHVPSLHGPDWCYADCMRRKVVPYKCGYHESWGDVTACSPDCNGGYCDHNEDSDNHYADQMDMKS